MGDPFYPTQAPSLNRYIALARVTWPRAVNPQAQDVRLQDRLLATCERSHKAAADEPK
jgi:hypothetical protein